MATKNAVRVRASALVVLAAGLVFASGTRAVGPSALAGSAGPVTARNAGHWNGPFATREACVARSGDSPGPAGDCAYHTDLDGGPGWYYYSLP